MNETKKQKIKQDLMIAMSQLKKLDSQNAGFLQKRAVRNKIEVYLKSYYLLQKESK